MPPPPEKLQRTLTLFDVYAISTGAMFSSGFFLLPGLATAKAGPAAILAYLLAGVLVLPAMFSQAELSTAMPKAGGTYYFLDRSLGPVAGTVGGLGTWLALIFKSAFALIGMGAYLVLFLDLPIKPVALALTVAFTVLNIFGAKETSGLQRLLVVTIVGVLAFFVAQGLLEVFTGDGAATHREQFQPFLPFGPGSLVATIGLVFVSYAGLTKVASVAEEVHDPDRNIPLGMFLSLATATLLYVVGVYIMVAVLDPVELRSDLTPVATAAEAFFDWFPEPVGLVLIVAAAIAAFASTANAGILSASRYPLAMGRDHLVAPRFAHIGKTGTPVLAILVTSGLMVVIIVAFSAEGVAKLASAFNLLVFGLLNLSVIVMRESRIPSYVPGYRSPFYPWMQIVGIITAAVLITTMGALSIGFTLAVIVVGIAWYIYYASEYVEREGAIYHLFERLGRRRYEGLDSELRTILKDKGMQDEAPFENLIARAAVIDLAEPVPYTELIARTSAVLSEQLSVPAERLEQGFIDASSYGMTPVAFGAALPHQRLPGIGQSELVAVRCREGIRLSAIPGETTDEGHARSEPVYALFFLVSPEESTSAHLRILAGIASRIDEEHFMDEWAAATDEQQLKESLLHHDRYLSLHLQTDRPTADLVGKALRDLRLPPGNLVALVRRRGRLLVPSGSTVLEEEDQITIIGEPKGIARLYEAYG
jgi:amino acid transporter/mannitol/fructose-specific phosphotransferase system IIA component (Ntr-type)